MAYIDSNRLLGNFKGMQDARKELETKINALEKNLDTLSRELQAMHADFEQKKKSMSKKERELSAELLNTKQQQFHSYRQTLLLTGSIHLKFYAIKPDNFQANPVSVRLGFKL